MRPIVRVGCSGTRMMGASRTTEKPEPRRHEDTKKAGTTENTEYTEEWTERDVGIPYRRSERGLPGPAIRFGISLALILGGRMIDPAHAVDERVLGLRQEYNAVAAQIDSVVRAMGWTTGMRWICRVCQSSAMRWSCLVGMRW